MNPDRKVLPRKKPRKKKQRSKVFLVIFVSIAINICLGWWYLRSRILSKDSNNDTYFSHQERQRREFVQYSYSEPKDSPLSIRARASIYNNNDQEQEHQHENQPSSSLFASIIKRRHGTSSYSSINTNTNINTNTTFSPSWKLVDWETDTISPLEESNFNCDFVNYTVKYIGQTVPICVHSFPDTVSDHIRKYQKWDDCFNLAHLWNGRRNNNNNDNYTDVYIEVGANIGSCVLEMLLATDAFIIAFEPHPMNIYNLKKTILNLETFMWNKNERERRQNDNKHNNGKKRKEKYKQKHKYKYTDRLALFPIGLGDVNHASSKIYSASDNMGNSVLGSIIKDFQKQSFDERLQYHVNVERMDSILDARYMDVKLFKVDAQGYECKVFSGMNGNENGNGNGNNEDINILANRVDLIKFEYASRWLEPQNCTHKLLPILRSNGFDVYGKLFRKGGFRLVVDNPGSGGQSEKGFDLVAMRDIKDRDDNGINRNIGINNDPAVANATIV